MYDEKDKSFTLKNFEDYSYLYFPLCNHFGLKSSITPQFNGDLKTDQHHFALTPVTNSDLLNINNARNVWFKVDGVNWSITGNSLSQLNNKELHEVKCGFLYQMVSRTNEKIKVTITSFVPELEENIEMHRVCLTNRYHKSIKVKTFVAVPIYGRSADNVRDHRHVSSLLNRVTIDKNIIYNKPTLSFDERGHVENDTYYSVLVSDILGQSPIKHYSDVNSFIGEGGSFLNPKALDEDLETTKFNEGYEALGGFEYAQIDLKPQESLELVFGISIAKKVPQLQILNNFDDLFVASQTKWDSYFKNLVFDCQNSEILKWVTIQPVLRRLYGCSFLPHHDYGKGGRGWRDLWQDCLALIKMDPTDVKDTIKNNFAGVRIDGSNATIIGDKPGEFKADRNNIARMWMDHGAWPLVTTKLYLENSNDYDLLFENAPYFKDSHICFSQKTIAYEASDYNQRCLNQEVYQGSILEHILVENMVIFFNVGKHNIFKLMGADWNDGLDMADENGESVAFEALYAKNLMDIADILNSLEVDRVEVFEELAWLINQEYDFENIQQKRTILETYFERTKMFITGNKVRLNKDYLIKKLHLMYEMIKNLINENEWLQNNQLGYYNGYYDNDFKQVEDINKKQMILTSQVFTIMSGISSDEQTKKIIAAADEILYDKSVGGYKLNANYQEVKTNLGRLFGFAYGHKENGSVFCHMAVMFANALYSRGFALEGRKVLATIMNSIEDFKSSKVYPGIPEYFDPMGRGMYPYLTGSASWLILTMIEQVFGVKTKKGKIIIEPKLTADEFICHEASIKTLVGKHLITITFVNEYNLEYGEYQIVKTLLNDLEVNSLSLSQVKNGDRIRVILDVRS